MPYAVQIVENDGELIQQLGLQDGDQMDATIENGTVVLRSIRTR